MIRITRYLRDIERDYAELDNVHTTFNSGPGLDPFPSSTVVQTRIRRKNLLVEIEVYAVICREGT